MKIKSSELSGAALDWAVAHATKIWETAHKWFPTMTLDPRFRRVEPRLGQCWLIANNPMRQGDEPFDPSENWSFSSEMFEEFCAAFHRDTDGTCWATVGMSQCSGNTILEAFCRALVTERSGTEVDVPDELI